MTTRALMIGLVVMMLATACVAVPAYDEPYTYSPTYCEGCWYGQWNGRIGYHRGGGRPWERRHTEAEHHGENRGRDVYHEGHR